MHRQQDEDSLFAEANEWLFRLSADDVTDSEKEAFMAWRASCPRHEKAWQEATGLLRSLKVPARAHAQISARSLRKTRSPAGGRRFATAASALAISAAAMIAAVQLPVYLDRFGAQHVTVAGERRAVSLPDGTRVEMNGDTALAFDFTTSERRVEVRRGEAYFVIASGERPFVVAAADAEIRDIGTAFSVENHARTQVTVAEGLVDVSRGGNAPVRVAARQMVDFGGDSALAVQEVDPDSALAWRAGEIVFREERLADVVAQLNRYRSGRIVILNPAIGDLLVSGVFDIDDPDRAVSALESVLGITARNVSPWFVFLT